MKYILIIAGVVAVAFLILILVSKHKNIKNKTKETTQKKCIVNKKKTGENLIYNQEELQKVDVSQFSVEPYVKQEPENLEIKNKDVDLADMETSVLANEIRKLSPKLKAMILMDVLKRKY
ncbi:MAG: hypothetical protein RR140_01585 [Clostridia bacterium]